MISAASRNLTVKAEGVPGEQASDAQLPAPVTTRSPPPPSRWTPADSITLGTHYLKALNAHGGDAGRGAEFLIG